MADKVDRSTVFDLLPAEQPELIIGLVGPIGVDLEIVSECLSAAVRDCGYSTHPIRLTALMKEFNLPLSLDAPGYIDSYKERIEYANAIREKTQSPAALAILAISAIRSHRLDSLLEEDQPCPATAYIIRQFKRPEEVNLLRRVYGKQFIQISAYAPPKYRIDQIAKKERSNSKGQINLTDAQNNANSLVKQDEKESGSSFGQNVRDAFPLADLFVDVVDKEACKNTISRFINALFGDNTASPSHDEYGMYLAKSASLRSSALTRQVGASIFRKTGEIISLGCNEVPKAGGGTYWHGDDGDKRDFVDGQDPNDIKKLEVLVDLVNRMQQLNYLDKSILGNHSQALAIATKMLEEKSELGIPESRLMDILEFGRDIHAEMSAITDAARKGVSVDGATLYCTTFPCHMCAKHIIAAGIKKVVYVEPYPKSYAEELHAEAIELDADPSVDNKKVNFARFSGISPYRYRDLFEKGKRKYGSGEAKKWAKGDVKSPMLEVIYPNYFQAEVYVVDLLKPFLPPK